MVMQYAVACRHDSVMICPYHLKDTCKRLRREQRATETCCDKCICSRLDDQVADVTLQVRISA